MLARIAHELYWLGRHLARAEQTARMLEGVFEADLQARPDDPSGVTLSWGSLMAIMGATWDGRPLERDEALAALTVDLEQPASVRSCIQRARESVRTLRAVVPPDMFEAVNALELELRGMGAGALRAGPQRLFRSVKDRSNLFWGLTGRTMLRDEASAFLAAGARLEDADMILRMLRVALPLTGADDPGVDGQAQALLRAVGGEQAFRRAVPDTANAPNVVRFLIFETAYPGSVAAHVGAVHGAIERADDAPRSSAPVLRLTRLAADLEFRRRDPEARATRGLVQTSERVQQELETVGDEIAERYFAGAIAPVTHVH